MNQNINICNKYNLTIKQNSILLKIKRYNFNKRQAAIKKSKFEEYMLYLLVGGIAVMFLCIAFALWWFGA